MVWTMHRLHHSDVSHLLFTGDPPQVYAWFGQCIVYIIVMFVEKFLMSLLVLFDFWKKVSSNSATPISNVITLGHLLTMCKCLLVLFDFWKKVSSDSSYAIALYWGTTSPCIISKHIQTPKVLCSLRNGMFGINRLKITIYMYFVCLSYNSCHNKLFQILFEIVYYDMNI